MFITKANGERELFRVDKLETSLRAAGVDEKTIKRVVAHIETEMVDGMTTTEIYNHAFELLRRYAKHPVAARYSLKRAVMDLGPTGFPFEKLLAEIFKIQGFEARTNVIMSGKCARHEIDFVAKRGNKMIVGEAKFHNEAGFKTDLKVVLYVDARFKDIRSSNFDDTCGPGQSCESWLVTNTHFTKNAQSYAACAGDIKLVGWDYPRKDNLQSMIENTGLHPLTCLTTLSRSEKQRLFDTGNVLCRSLTNNEDLLRRVGVVGSKASEVLQEAKLLCIPPTAEKSAH